MNSNATIIVTVTISAIVILPLLIMAIVLLSGRGGALIAGYNTMSKKKKALYDEKAMCRATGGFLLVFIIFLGLIQVGTYSATAWLTITATALLIVLTVGFLIFMNTGKRFMKDKTAETPIMEKKNSRASKTTIIAVAVVSAIILIGVAALLIFGGKEPNVLFVEGGIQINAIFGGAVEFRDVESISLVEQSMNQIGPVRRTNGFGGFGQVKKGSFSSEALGNIRLYVQSETSPTIWIKCYNARDVYISFRDSEATRVLYNELISSFIQE